MTQEFWPQTVSAALLGTATRPVRRSGSDPVVAAYLDRLSLTVPSAEFVLHTAALSAVAANACGPEPVAGLTLLPAAASDPRPVMSDRLAAATRDSLVFPGAARWCLTPIAAAGLRSPLRLLPTLLRHTADHPESGEVVSALVGPRGVWLATAAPQLGAHLGGVAPAVPDHAEWDALRAPERMQAVKGLGLVAAGTAAEALCEHALDDRSVSVRAAAADRLAGTVGTAYEGRMRARAGALVQRKRGVLRDKLEVARLGEPDAEAIRDGIIWPPLQGVSAAAHWIGRLTAALPLTAWEQLLDATPASLLEAGGEYRAEFRDGWRRTVVRQRDARWAAALAESGEPADLALVAGPWPDTVCDKVFRAFVQELKVDDWRPPPEGVTALIDAAGASLPIGARSPWPHRMSVLIAQGSTSRARFFAPLNDILRLRTVIHEELP